MLEEAERQSLKQAEMTRKKLSADLARTVRDYQARIAHLTAFIDGYAGRFSSDVPDNGVVPKGAGLVRARPGGGKLRAS